MDVAGTELASHFTGQHLVDFVKDQGGGMKKLMENPRVDRSQFERLVLQIFRQCEKSCRGPLKDNLQEIIDEMRLEKYEVKPPEDEEDNDDDDDDGLPQFIRVQGRFDACLLALGLGDFDLSDTTAMEDYFHEKWKESHQVTDKLVLPTLDYKIKRLIPAKPFIPRNPGGEPEHVSHSSVHEKIRESS
jgi:hypothetical protein